MSEFLRTLISGNPWMHSTYMLGGMLVAMTMWAVYYWLKAQRAMPEGCVYMTKAEYKKREEENAFLAKECFELKQELDDLRAQPKPDRVKPVIDWITLNATDTNYEPDLDEYEIGYLLGVEYHTIQFKNLSEAQVRELNEEFKLCIKNKHQPARFG